MNDSLASRLKLFIDNRGLSNSQFADQCGIPRPSLSQILSGRNKKVSDVLVGLIHAAFPDLSIVWLLFGEGDMLVSAANSGSETENGQILRNENPVFAGDGQESDGHSILKGLNAPLSGGNISDLERIEYERKLVDLHKQIDNLQKQLEDSKQKPRRVAQITVYYDDSTFETFLPK